MSEKWSSDRDKPSELPISSNPWTGEPVGSCHKSEGDGRSTFAQGLSGFIAGFSNVIITFPINKAMLRQQLDGHQTTTVITQMKKEGFANLYRGLGPVLLQKTVASSIMFGTFGYFSHALETSNPAPKLLTTHHRRNFVAGGLSGAVEAFLTPFERMQALMIDSRRHMQFRNSYEAFHYVRKIGLKEVYRGYTCIIVRNSLSSSLWFSLRTLLKDKAVASTSASNPGYQRTRSQELILDFCTGSLIGASLSTVFYPVAVAKMKMMEPVGAKEPFLSIWGALKLAYIQRDRSLLRMYTGAYINFPRSLLSWGIINAVYEFSLTTFFPNG